LKNARLEIQNFVATSDPSVANFSSVISKNSEGFSVINVTMEFAYEISKMMINYELLVPKDKNDKNYEKLIIKSNVNACRMVNGIKGDFLTKMIMEDFKNYADFELKCPLPKVQKIIIVFNLNL
jgi:hypothetical protein